MRTTIFLLIFSLTFLHAQNGVDRINQSWDSAVSRIDAAWISALKRGWISKEIEPEKKPYEEPKPDKLPIVTPVLVKPELPSHPVELVPPVKRNPPPVKEWKAPQVDPDSLIVKVPLYGNRFSLPYPIKFSELRAPELTPSGIADFWGKMSSLPFQSTLEWIKLYQSEVLHSDWMLHGLLDAFAAAAFPKNETCQTLYKWFLYNKLGYSARLSYNQDGCYLLLASDTPLYGISFFTFKETKFILLPEDGKNVKLKKAVFTYPDNYQGADRKLNLALSELPNVPDRPTEKVLRFSFQNQNYAIPVLFQSNLAGYFQYYPQMDIALYGKSPMSEAARRSLYDGVAPYLKNKSETEAVAFLLALTQKSFAYETDQEQFGREKWFFPEETLYYPYSDCEDRAVFFAQMVRLTLGLEVVFLNYPGHMATAVKLSQPIGEDSVTFDGKKLAVCDPTYIGAGPGMAMPQFKKVLPKISEIR
jgi:hypothetical protein